MIIAIQFYFPHNQPHIIHPRVSIYKLKCIYAHIQSSIMPFYLLERIEIEVYRNNKYINIKYLIIMINYINKNHKLCKEKKKILTYHFTTENEVNFSQGIHVYLPWHIRCSQGLKTYQGRIKDVTKTFVNVPDTSPWRNELVLVLEINPLSIGSRMVNIPSCMQELTSLDKIVYNHQNN